MSTMIEQIQPASIYQVLNHPIHKSKARSSLSSLTSISDESDDDDQQNNSLVSYRCSSPLSYSEFYPKKFHSVKLTRAGIPDSRRKKAVHFADEFGLSLSQMKMIDTDELPFIPNERMDVITYMQPQYKNSMYSEDFNTRVFRQKIALEQANAIDNRIYGTVRLVSLGLHKRVKIHLTTDNWISFRDYEATYINNSYDGICDRFSFFIEIDRDQICIGNTIQFCICYEFSWGLAYWDNNFQQNYRFNCLSRTILD